jgi:hypothetical protein
VCQSGLPVFTKTTSYGRWRLKLHASPLNTEMRRAWSCPTTDEGCLLSHGTTCDFDPSTPLKRTQAKWAAKKSDEPGNHLPKKWTKQDDHEGKCTPPPECQWTKALMPKEVWKYYMIVINNGPTPPHRNQTHTQMSCSRYDTSSNHVCFCGQPVTQ